MWKERKREKYFEAEAIDPEMRKRANIKVLHSRGAFEKKNEHYRLLSWWFVTQKLNDDDNERLHAIQHFIFAYACRNLFLGW